MNSKTLLSAAILLAASNCRDIVSQEMNDHITGATSKWIPQNVESNQFKGYTKSQLHNRMGAIGAEVAGVPNSKVA